MHVPRPSTTVKAIHASSSNTRTNLLDHDTTLTVLSVLEGQCSCLPNGHHVPRALGSLDIMSNVSVTKPTICSPSLSCLVPFVSIIQQQQQPCSIFWSLGNARM